MNRLEATIRQVESNGRLSRVTARAGEADLSCVILETPETVPYLAPDTPVYLLFKETEVAIGTGDTGGLSLSNRIPVVIEHIEAGDILAVVRLRHPAFAIGSIITRHSLERLELATGMAATALIKANEISIMERETWDSAGSLST